MTAPGLYNHGMSHARTQDDLLVTLDADLVGPGLRVGVPAVQHRQETTDLLFCTLKRTLGDVVPSPKLQARLPKPAAGQPVVLRVFFDGVLVAEQTV